MADVKSILVTGGAGFIGGNFVYRLCTQGYKVINLDALTYAGHLETLGRLSKNNNHIFVEGRIGDSDLLDKLLNEYNPDRIVNLAAESHVDRSIDAPATFVETNVVEMQKLLERALKYYESLDADKKSKFRFLHVSTDEVYGSLGKTGLFTEESPYAPNSPYAASKAASDHFVRAYLHTYGLPTLITNCSNNYGPYQYPEKLIPLMILNALNNKPLPVYGTGENVRDWLYVDDHCSGILAVLENGAIGEKYNIGGNQEKTNLEVVKTICSILDELVPKPDNQSYQEQIVFVEDRPGHDLRYAIDASKIKKELGWTPSESFLTGMKKTVKWYINNVEWCKAVTVDSYDMSRLGTRR